MIVGIICTISVIVNGFLGYACFNVLRKLDFYDQFFDAKMLQIEDAVQKMRNIDLRGAFESDDEVGAVFKELKLIVESLAEFIGVADGTKENQG